MIRHADKHMLPQLIRLWEACFGDGEEYSSFFFSHKMIGTEYFENQLVYIEDDKVVSMLSILPAKIRQKNGLKTFWYIYGVATAVEYRSRGYAGNLIHYVFELAKQENAVVGLVPASESLYGYYEKMGFQTYFYKKKMERLVDEDIEDQTQCNTDYKIEPISTYEYYALRNETFDKTGNVLWDMDAVDYALAENRELGGEAVKVIYKQKLYFALFYGYEGVFYMRETNLPYEILLEATNQFAKMKSCTRFVISTWVNTGTSTQDIVKHGMVYNGDVFWEKGYLGLALD